MSQDRCIHCGQPAEIQFTDVVGDRIETAWLCASCSIEQGLLAWEPGAELAGTTPEGLAEIVTPEAAAPAPGGRVRCPDCGSSLVQIRRTGRVGCGSCYESFREQLDPLIERVHGALEHHGMDGGEMGQKARRHEEIAQLQRALQAAVQREDYEGAARLRDDIRRQRGAPLPPPPEAPGEGGGG